MDDYHVGSAATLLEAERDKSTFLYGANAVTGRDFTLDVTAFGVGLVT